VEERRLAVQVSLGDMGGPPAILDVWDNLVSPAPPRVHQRGESAWVVSFLTVLDRVFFAVVGFFCFLFVPSTELNTMVALKARPPVFFFRFPFFSRLPQGSVFPLRDTRRTYLPVAPPHFPPTFFLGPEERTERTPLPPCPRAGFRFSNFPPIPLRDFPLLIFCRRAPTRTVSPPLLLPGRSTIADQFFLSKAPAFFF